MKLRSIASHASCALLVLATLSSASEAGAKPPAPKKPKAAVAAPEPEPPPPPPAPPHGPPSLGDTLTGEPKSDYAAGKVLFGDGDHAGALVKFSSAYAKSSDARLLWNMAACEKNLRHYAKALGLVRKYLKEGDAVLSPKDKADGADLVKVMEPFTAKLQIVVDSAGAEVFLDDEALGTSPVEPVVVDIGVRKLRVRKSGFEEITRDVVVGGAAQISTDVKLVRIVHEGRLVVQAPSDATVSLDGKVVGSGGTWTGSVASGGHTLRVVAPKKRPYQTEVLVQDKQTREFAVTLEAEESRGVPAWVWVAGGVVAAGGLATAGYFIFKPSGAYDGATGNLQPGVVQAGAPVHFR